MVLNNLFIIGYIVIAIVLTFILPKMICKNPKAILFCIKYKLYDTIGLDGII